MSSSGTTSSLIVGCDLITSRLKYFLSPMSLLYKFDPNPPYRPRPLALTVALSICSVPFVALLVDSVGLSELKRSGHDSMEYHLLMKSTFLLRLAKVFVIYRICYICAVYILTLAHHCPIANVMASNNNMVTEREQRNLADRSFAVFLFTTIANCFSYIVILTAGRMTANNYLAYNVVFLNILGLLFNMTLAAPLIYTCYLGGALGKHVENFSQYYVDSMFDQFMKAIEVVGSSNPDHLRLPPGNNSLKSDKCQELDQCEESESDEKKRKRSKLNCWCCCCCTCFCAVFNHLKLIVLYFYRVLKRLVAVLNAREYPELPEMKMTKLSSTTNIQISDAKRIANTHLIRIRLRRTQIMLSELRDMVSDINKLSSPIIMMLVIYETALIILITTASIQAKVYKSINWLILPTLTNTIGLVISVVYICICLDASTSQLKLMINKLFDFIILNHRVQTIRKADDSSAIELRLLSAASEREKEALSETWSQFQYTRKLANTIQFTMGGILPVSRRLVLSTLGHVLSAVFIAIEVMSIIDTSHLSSTESGAGGVGTEFHDPTNFTSHSHEDHASRRPRMSLVDSTTFSGSFFYIKE